MKFFYILIVLLIKQLAFSGEVSISACSNSKKNLRKTYNNALFLKVNTDRVTLNNNCVDIFTSSQKEKLFTKFLKSKLPNLKITSTSDQQTLRSCHLTLTKEYYDQELLKGAKNLKAKVFFQDYQRLQKKSEQTKISILDGTKSFIKVDDEKLYLKCELRKRFMNIFVSAESKKFHVKSNFHLYKGKKIEIGSYQKNENKKSGNIHLIKNSFQSSNKNLKIIFYLEGKEGQ